MLSGECYEFNEDNLLQKIMACAKTHNGDGKFRESLRALESRMDKYAKRGVLSNYELEKCRKLLNAFKRVKL